jgi:hypothetical protein
LRIFLLAQIVNVIDVLALLLDVVRIVDASVRISVPIGSRQRVD